MKVKIKWSVTEEHEAELEFEDETELELFLEDADSTLAEHEDGESYVGTLERDIVEWEEA